MQSGDGLGVSDLLFLKLFRRIQDMREIARGIAILQRIWQLNCWKQFRGAERRIWRRRGSLEKNRKRLEL